MCMCARVCLGVSVCETRNEQQLPGQLTPSALAQTRQDTTPGTCRPPRSAPSSRHTHTHALSLSCLCPFLFLFSLSLTCPSVLLRAQHLLSQTSLLPGSLPLRLAINTLSPSSLPKRAGGARRSAVTGEQEREYDTNTVRHTHTIHIHTQTQNSLNTDHRQTQAQRGRRRQPGRFRSKADWIHCKWISGVKRPLFFLHLSQGFLARKTRCKRMNRTDALKRVSGLPKGGQTWLSMVIREKFMDPWSMQIQSTIASCVQSANTNAL